MNGVAFMLALVGGATIASAQAPAPSVARFEVASVKPAATTATTGPASASSFRVSPSGLVAITNYSVHRLITLAYGIEHAYERHSPEGGPAAIMSRRFDVAARIPTDAATLTAPITETSLRATAQVMLRALLSERFGLRVRSEARQLRDPTTLNAQGIRQLVGQRERNAGPLSRLLPGIQGFADRPLVDATGLPGQFEWQLEVAMPGADTSPYPTLSSALQEQLGLRLEARTASIAVIVIEAVAMPTAD